MTFFESRWLYYLFGQVWIWCRRKWIWAFYPFEKLVFKNVLKILLINIWIFIPLLIYIWGVEGVTPAKRYNWTQRIPPFFFGLEEYHLFNRTCIYKLLVVFSSSYDSIEEYYCENSEVNLSYHMKVWGHNLCRKHKLPLSTSYIY